MRHFGSLALGGAVAAVALLSLPAVSAQAQWQKGTVTRMTYLPSSSGNCPTEIIPSSNSASVEVKAYTGTNPPALPRSASASVECEYRQNYDWVGGGTPTASFTVTPSGNVNGSVQNAGGNSAQSTLSGELSSGGFAPSLDENEMTDYDYNVNDTSTSATANQSASNQYAAYIFVTLNALAAGNGSSFSSVAKATASFGAP